MQATVRNPTDGIYPATDDYVHAMEVIDPLRLLYVSGTMGLDEHGNAAERLEDQLVLIWSNIRRILAEADMTTENIVRVTSYLRDASFAEANGNARITALGSRRVPTTAIVAATLAPDWLVEIEIIASA